MGVTGRREFLRDGLLLAASLPLQPYAGQWCGKGFFRSASLANQTAHCLQGLGSPHVPHGRETMYVPPVYKRPPLSIEALEPFVDRLPILPKAQPIGTRRSPEPRGGMIPFYQVRMKEFLYQVHRGLPPTRIWGYDGLAPGPTFEVNVGAPVMVEWVNELPTRHFLPIDHTIHGAETNVPDVRGIVHLHGGHVPPESDGFPENWYTPAKSLIDFYPNRQRAATLWYHDHALGITRLNSFAGLSGGFYLIRDRLEKSLRLPGGEFEIPLVIQDRNYDDDGQLNYPISKHPEAIRVSEFLGNVILVNGKAVPYLEVEPRKYRFRILNASNSRFYSLTLSSGDPFIQIGTDQGLGPHPVSLNSILLAPAERSDVIIDFSRRPGARIELNNDALVPYPGGGGSVPPRVMQFRVQNRRSSKDTSAIPSKLAPYQPMAQSLAVKTRNLSLVEYTDRFGVTQMSLLNNACWDDPITERPVIDTIEIWNFMNITDDSHPIHIHLVPFQIIGRRPFDMASYAFQNRLVYSGPLEPPGPGEIGWKDVVRADSGMVTSVIVKFEGYTGKYVWHCHMLEHEDNEMMRPFEVVTAT